MFSPIFGVDTAISVFNAVVYKIQFIKMKKVTFAIKQQRLAWYRTKNNETAPDKFVIHVPNRKYAPPVASNMESLFISWRHDDVMK